MSHNNKIIVRQASLADATLIAPLFDAYRQFYQQTSNIELAQQFIHERLARQESVIYLALNTQDKILGFTQLYPTFESIRATRSFILNDLYVYPELRGQGLATALLNAAKEHAILCGAQSLELSTAINNPAQKLYRAQGYILDTIYHHYSLTLD